MRGYQRKMGKQARKIAVCGMTAALGVVIMLLGNVLSLGMYLAPMLVGLCLTVLGKEWGIRYQVLLWLAIGLLSFILISNPEQNLMFIGLFGWYPILRPSLQKLPTLSRVTVKFLMFNLIVIALEALLILVLVPEILGTGLMILLLLLGNVIFFVYDFAIPRFEVLAEKYWKRFNRF